MDGGPAETALSGVALRSDETDSTRNQERETLTLPLGK